jgi:sortase (surface protein transpeptidase)
MQFSQLDSKNSRRTTSEFLTNIYNVCVMKKFTSIFSLLFALGAPAVGAMEITSATIGSAPASTGVPLYLYIPSIQLFTVIQGVGIDQKGNMDVPSGKTNNVGWYQYGPVPGSTGTAVLDAHNTAAFKELNKVPVGEDIYIFTSEAKWLHFTVTQAETYSMQVLKPTTLFAATNSKQINLITCAGQSLGNGEATHRLIVSAQLAA